MSERDRWDRLAATQPYWSVLIDDRNRADRFDDAARLAFFKSGETEIAATLSTARTVAGGATRPERALDFGCGVARLTIPLASEFDAVVAVDISENMLAEARDNCARASVNNVTFRLTDELLSSEVSRDFDFIHSFIVFQHIPPREGLRIPDGLLSRLRVGGIGALHFTYARRASQLRRVVNRLRRRIRAVDVVVKLLRGEPLDEPTIPMYEYDLRQIRALLQQHGCRELTVEQTDHGGHLGAMLFFRMEA